MSTGVTTKHDTFLKLPLTLPNSRLAKKKKKKKTGNVPHDKQTCQVASSNLSFAAIA